MSIKTTTINDLRNLGIDNPNLSPQQRLALKNFDRYRSVELNKTLSEADFQKKYAQIQVIANLSPFQEFLKEKYCS